MTVQFTGQDVQCRTLADAHNVYICKRRDPYMYCSFKSSGDRAAYKTALAAVANIHVADFAFPYDPSLYVVKITPT